MKHSSKLIITTIAVIGISVAGYSLVSAGGWRGCQGYGMQSGQNTPMGFQGFGGRHGKGMMGGAPGTMMENRMEYMKQYLQITAEQEPAWESFQQAMTTKMSLLAERFQQRGAQIPVADRTDRMRRHAEQMGAMADVIDNFYAMLTPEQQKLADSMTPMMGSRF